MVPIVLDGPGKNALGTDLMVRLDEALIAAGGRPVLLSGAGDAFSANLHRYGVFYVTTSLPWDLGRAVLSALVLLLAGSALLRALRRASRRAAFDAVATFE